MNTMSAEEIVKDLAAWSKKYPRDRIYSMSRKDMDDELIALEERAKEYASQSSTPVQKVKMALAIEKNKERGAVEAEIILTKMVHTDQKLYEQILDSDLAFYFNELCKKAIAYDKNQKP